MKVKLKRKVRLKSFRVRDTSDGFGAPNERRDREGADGSHARYGVVSLRIGDRATWSLMPPILSRTRSFLATSGAQHVGSPCPRSPERAVRLRALRH